MTGIGARAASMKSVVCKIAETIVAVRIDCSDTAFVVDVFSDWLSYCASEYVYQQMGLWLGARVLVQLA
jgi:hypothetical protein